MILISFLAVQQINFSAKKLIKLTKEHYIILVDLPVLWPGYSMSMKYEVCKFRSETIHN